MTAAVRAAARCLALDAMAAAVFLALKADRIPSVLIKGPATGHRLYPDQPGRRQYSDVDLLVAPATFTAAQEVLSRLGYLSLAAGVRDGEGLWHERPWQAPGPIPLVVDLHRGFARVGEPEAFWAALASSAESLSLAGTTVAVPDEACSALLIGLHTGSTDKPHDDLVRALAVVDDDVWKRAAAIAATCDAASAFAAGLRRVPAGAALAAALGLPDRVAPVDWMRATRASSTGYALARLAAEPGAGARWRWLQRNVVPSPAYLRLTWPLARRGRVGLALTYLLRLVRHGWYLRRGLGDLSAAAAQAPVPSGRRPACCAGARAVVWSARAGRLARRQLGRGPLHDIDLPAAPVGAGFAAVGTGLRLSRASCLERSLVMQRWYAGREVRRELVVGVTAPVEGFRAHAWLAGDADGDRPDLVEILRRPPPEAWIADPAGPYDRGRRP
ncbi:MAG: nucleotidyltransferase family protein [Frankia sp.]